MVWQDSEVGKFANEKFVNLRVTVSDDNYGEWKKKFKTPGTPTVLFLDADGEEIDRFIGFGGDEDAKVETFQMVKDFAAGINTLPVILAEHEKNPEDVDINFKLAKKYLSRYEIPKAAPIFTKVLELDPDDAKGYKEEATYRVALDTARSKRDPAAMEAFIATNPKNQDFLYSAYTTVASTHARNKDMDKAKAAYEAGITALPDNGGMAYSYASAIFNYKMEDLYDKGLELNEKAKALDPNYESSTVYNLITYYGNTKQNDKLIALYEKTIEERPNMKGSYAATIARLEIEEKYDYAIEMMQEEIHKEENAKSGYLWYTIGRLFAKKGDIENALTHMKKAIEITPGAASYYQKEIDKLEKELQEK